jgi:hypothetical protein
MIRIQACLCGPTLEWKFLAQKSKDAYELISPTSRIRILVQGKQIVDDFLSIS